MEQTHANYGSTKTMEETLEDDTSMGVLPRAVLRPSSFILLDGEWNFAIDSADKGIQEGWFLGHAYEHRANWPGNVEQHIEGVKQEQSISWHDKGVVWYEREFPKPSLESLPHSMVQLTFGACGYETRIWLNGHPMLTIEGEETHIGEYTSFSYELPDHYLRPVNRLTVRIAVTMDADTPRGKQESHVFKRGGIWYQTYTGAVRSIWLETVERNRLRTRVGVVSLVEDRLVRFNLTTRIHDPGPYTIRLKVYENKDHKENPIAQDDFPLLLQEGQKQQRVVLDLPGANLWSPEEPNLYHLVAELIDSKGYISEVETHFGLRKIESRGCFIYLNNNTVYLDGILYQPGTATYDEIKRHMYAMKKLGCNIVRIHIAGVDPRIYKLADKIGLMLWVEVPSPHQSSKRSRNNHRDELIRMLSLIETHPSVVMWSLYNEDWGAQDIATNGKTRNYIAEMYHYMLIHHPQFLVVDNDGWQHISEEGRLKSDLLTAHLYTPDIRRWEELLDKMIGGDMDDVAAYPLVVGDPFFYRRQVPIVISEWGGFGFSNYGGPEGNNERAELIQTFKQALRKRSIAGDIYTQATDIEDEQNGIIDFKTGKLKVPDAWLSSRGMDKKENYL